MQSASDASEMANISLFCVCLLAIGWAAYSPLPKGTLLTSVGAAVGILWLLGTMTHLNQALAITRPLLLGAPGMTERLAARRATALLLWQSS